MAPAIAAPSPLISRARVRGLYLVLPAAMSLGLHSPRSWARALAGSRSRSIVCELADNASMAVIRVATAPRQSIDSGVNCTLQPLLFPDLVEPKLLQPTNKSSRLRVPEDQPGRSPTFGSKPRAQFGLMPAPGLIDGSLLRQKLDEADAACGVAAEVYAVRVVRIDVDPPCVGFGLRKWEFDPLFGLRVEAGDLVDLMLGDPDVAVLPVHDHRIVAARRRRRCVQGHCPGLVVDLHELASIPQRDPKVTVGVGVHAAREGVTLGVGDLVLVDPAGLRVDARHDVGLVLGKPYRAVARDRHAIGAGRRLVGLCARRLEEFEQIGRAHV